jgi:hypothetical protein
MGRLTMLFSVGITSFGLDLLTSKIYKKPRENPRFGFEFLTALKVTR